MPMHDATKTIKQFNPDNKSGAVKKALEMIQSLQQVNGMMNPDMMSSVGGGGHVGSMIQDHMNLMQGQTQNTVANVTPNVQPNSAILLLQSKVDEALSFTPDAWDLLQPNTEFFSNTLLDGKFIIENFD